MKRSRATMRSARLRLNRESRSKNFAAERTRPQPASRDGLIRIEIHHPIAEPRAPNFRPPRAQKRDQGRSGQCHHDIMPWQDQQPQAARGQESWRNPRPAATWRPCRNGWKTRGGFHAPPDFAGWENRFRIVHKPGGGDHRTSWPFSARAAAKSVKCWAVATTSG